MSTVKISALPRIDKITRNDVLIVNDQNQVTAHITWADTLDTLTTSNLTFTGSLAFDGSTKIGDQTYYTQGHLANYPGIQITQSQQDNWDEAHSWGDHSEEGYLKGLWTQSLDDLSDVNVATAVSGRVLKFNGTHWYPAVDNNDSFSGDYNDLTNRPIIPTNNNQLVNGAGYITNADLGDYVQVTDLDAYALKTDLDAYALKTDLFSGDYNDLTNQPIIPTNNNQLTNGMNYLVVADLAPYALKSELFSGSYNDLSDKPTIPTDNSELANGAGYITSTSLDDYTPTVDLADVATSGDYDDLLNQPTIPTDNSELANGAGYLINTDLDPYALKTELFSGSYNDLSDTPTIPSDNTELTNGAGYITLGEVPSPDLEGALIFRGTVANQGELPVDAVVGDLYYVTADDELFGRGETQWHQLGSVADLSLYALKTDLDDYTPTADLAAVATSGSYNDLSDKPTIPTNNSELTNGAGYLVDADLDPYALKTDLDPYALKTELFSGSYNDLTNQPTIPTDNDQLANSAGYITSAALDDYTLTADLATVATTGDYDDLLNQPTIPTDNSQLVNGMNYLTNTDLDPYALKIELFSGSYNDLSDKPDIPQNTSDLTNDSNFITLSDLPDSSTPTISEVLAEDNTAASLQSLSFHKPNGENIPFVMHPEWWPFPVDTDASPYPSPDPYQFKSRSSYRNISATHSFSVNWDADSPDYVWDSSDDMEVWATSLNFDGIVSQYQYENVFNNLSLSSQAGLSTSKEDNNFYSYAEVGRRGIGLVTEPKQIQTDYISSALYFNSNADRKDYKNSGLSIYFSTRIKEIDTVPTTAIAVGVTPDPGHRDSNEAPKFHVDSAGSCTATEFVGDGSKLTGIAAGLTEAPLDTEFSYGRASLNSTTNKWEKVLPYDFTTLPALT